MSLNRPVTKREWVWVLVVASLVIAASTAPYLVGYLSQTTELRFSGAPLDLPDYNSHLAKMWQGYRGQWAYTLLFTSEEQQPVYVQTFYTPLGQLARLTGMGLPLTYQVARVVFALLMLLAVYRFIAHFTPAVRTRRVAFLLAVTASGLGWLTEVLAPTPPGGISPMDWWLLDAFTYLGILVFPHFCASTALLLLIFILFLRRPDGPSLRDGVLAALAALALSFIHPYLLLLADLLPILYWGVEWLRTRRVVWRGLAAVALMGIAQAPPLLYDVWVFRTHSIFGSWSAQNINLSPPLPVYLWGYGVLLVLGVIGAVTWARRGRPGLAFPLPWVGLVAVLAYLPWGLQRRFLEGVQVPLGLLAGVGLAEGLVRPAVGGAGNRLRWLAQAAVVALAATSNLYLTAGLTLAAGTRAPAMFLPADKLAAVDWLGQNTSWDETVLAGFAVGNLIPARIGHRVVLGHWMETMDYGTKRDQVAAFYSADSSSAQRLRLLEQWGVRYVYFGPDERQLGSFDPSSAPYLASVFHSGDVVIYRVLQIAEYRLQIANCKLQTAN